jgi:hypothetical protein
MTLAPPTAAQSRESRGVDGISAPRGIEIPSPATVLAPDPDKASDRVNRLNDDGADAARQGIKLIAPSQVDTADTPPNTSVPNDTDYGANPTVTAAVASDATARLKTRHDGPTVMFTGDQRISVRPIVISPGLKSISVDPRPTSRSLTGIRRTGPKLISVDEAGVAQLTVLAARESKSPRNGPAVISRNGLDGDDRPDVIYRGDRLGE